MAGFTKLFSTLITSTLWQEDDHTRIVWITMLALTDHNGYVAASMPGLAHAARVTHEQCEAALALMVRPDPHSRTKDNEGRRLEEVDGGWQLLNYEKYRAMGRAEDRRGYFAARQRKIRAKAKPGRTKEEREAIALGRLASTSFEPPDTQ